MINLSQKNVVKIAKETNFIKDNVEKVMRLADILEFVFTSKWKDKLALKGGTAINLFYRELPRLSVDIDLDYIGDTKEEMEKDKEELWSFLQMALFQKNYSLSPQSKRYFALDSAVFQYINNANMTEARFFTQVEKEKLWKEGCICSYCNQRILSIEDAEVDHVLAFSKGGKTTLDNAQLLHRHCNREKNNKEVGTDAVSFEEESE